MRGEQQYVETHAIIQKCIRQASFGKSIYMEWRATQQPDHTFIRICKQLPRPMCAWLFVVRNPRGLRKTKFNREKRLISRVFLFYVVEKECELQEKPARRVSSFFKKEKSRLIVVGKMNEWMWAQTGCEKRVKMKRKDKEWGGLRRWGNKRVWMYARERVRVCTWMSVCVWCYIYKIHIKGHNFKKYKVANGGANDWEGWRKNSSNSDDDNKYWSTSSSKKRLAIGVAMMTTSFQREHGRFGCIASF